MLWFVAVVLATASAPSLDQALALEQQGDDAHAASTLDAVLSQQPTYGLAHLEAGRLALKRDDLGRARLELEIATALLPENPRAQFFFGMMEEESGKGPEAVAALERAVALRPDFVEARLRLGTLYLSQGDALHAEAHYQAVAKVDPSQVGARLQLARALELEGRVGDAEQTLTELRAEQPASPLVIRNLADFYERSGRPELARSVRGQLDGPSKRHLRSLKPSRR